MHSRTPNTAAVWCSSLALLLNGAGLCIHTAISKRCTGRGHASGARNSASRQQERSWGGAAFRMLLSAAAAPPLRTLVRSNEPPSACAAMSRHQRRRMVEEKMWLRCWAAAEPKLKSQGTRALPAAALPKQHLMGGPLPPSAVAASSSSSASSATFLGTIDAGRSTRAPSPAAATVMAAAAPSRLGGRAG